MENENVREVHPTGALPAITAEKELRMLSVRYASRGLSVSVKAEAEEQMRTEEKTRELSPLAYRMSEMSEATVQGHYRQGKDSMDGTDLVRYFDETREMRCSTSDFSESVSIYEEAVPDETERAVMISQDQVTLRGAGKRTLIACKDAVKSLSEAKKVWFDSSRPKTDKETRRFPLSAFAAIVAVAVSLMLIVASSVMLTRAESNISRLNLEISKASTAVNELRSDLEARHDLLQIRDIAIHEYGMVDESFVKMEYISIRDEDKIEAFEETRRATVGLSAILSALGLKK